MKPYKHESSFFELYSGAILFQSDKNRGLKLSWVCQKANILAVYYSETTQLMMLKLHLVTYVQWGDVH